MIPLVPMILQPSLQAHSAAHVQACPCSSEVKHRRALRRCLADSTGAIDSAAEPQAHCPAPRAPCRKMPPLHGSCRDALSAATIANAGARTSLSVARWSYTPEGDAERPVSDRAHRRPHACLSHWLDAGRLALPRPPSPDACRPLWRLAAAVSFFWWRHLHPLFRPWRSHAFHS